MTGTRWWQFGLACLLLGLCAACGAQAQRGDTTQALLEAVNAERRAHGVRPLTSDSRLARAAAAHARDLAATGRFDHEGTDGSHVGDRVSRQGFRWSHVAENLAVMSGASASSVVRVWMRSPMHRSNILSPAVTKMGVGRIGKIWVLVLAG